MSGFTPEMKERAQSVIGLYPEKRSALIPLCHLAQEQDGYLSEELMEEIASLLDVSPAEVYGTASFYDMFHTEPVGRYLVGICTNIACLLQGADLLLGHAAESLGIAVGGTTQDSLFTLEELECVAHCDNAPCVQVNYRYFGPLDSEGFDELMGRLRRRELDDVVPPHGTLMRTQREIGLQVSFDEVVHERHLSDQAILNRKAALESAKEKGE